MKKLIPLLLLFFLLSNCYTTHYYDGRKGYRLFFTPSVKREYCKDQETVLENAAYFYRKVFGKDKDYYMFKIMIREDSCCFYIHYYGWYPDVEGSDWIGKENKEITLSKAEHKILDWR